MQTAQAVHTSVVALFSWDAMSCQLSSPNATEKIHYATTNKEVGIHSGIRTAATTWVKTVLRTSGNHCSAILEYTSRELCSRMFVSAR